jgi:hypothetical protein
MTYDTVAYASGDCGPGNLANNIADIQGSGLTTLILWALHIGRPLMAGQQSGDFIFNDDANLFISEGKFNPSGSTAIAAWPGQIAELRQQGSVGKVYFSIGGVSPPVQDFSTIQYMFNNGLSNVLVENVAALKQAFTVNGVCVIDGFDLDCEEYVDQSTIVGLCQILFDQGFAVSFCPYINPTYWQECMRTLWNKGLKVSRWNLQCYSGGFGNRGELSAWIANIAAVVGEADAPSYLVPGLAVVGQQDPQCPTGQESICTTFAGWSSLGLPGGFLWLYDSILAHPDGCKGTATLLNYVAAINNGLSDNC